MTANALASVSLAPFLLLVCVDHAASTHAHLHAKRRFGVNILAEHQRVISEYYARPERSHEQAETEPGCASIAPRTVPRSYKGPWPIWNAA